MEDLSTGEEEAEVFFETTDVNGEIAAACSAINTVSELDTALMTKQDERRKGRIIRKSLAIIDVHIGYLYGCLFGEQKEEE